MALFFTHFYEDLQGDSKKAFQYVENTIRKIAFHKIPQHKRYTESIKNNAHGIVYLGMANKLPQPELASEATMEMERASWDESQKKQYKDKTECFLTTTKKALQARGKSCVFDNEKVEIERFTYLEKPFKWIQTHTSVFYRRTNLAEYCLIVLGHVVRPVHAREETEELICYEAPCNPRKDNTKSGSAVVAGIAINLAKGLLQGVGKKVGVLIFDSIFPPGSPNYFTEVYKQIEQIVNQELTSETIDEINAQINAMKDWVAVVYTNAKESGTQSNKELTDLIQPREPELAIELVGVLMNDRYASTGITGFMIGAGMHLAVLQELAFVDPNASPSNSFYVNSVKQYAQQYADHAKSTTSSILQQRKNKVVGKYHIYYSSAGTVDKWYWFEDGLTGYKSESWIEHCDAKGCHDTDASSKRDSAMASYQTDVANELNTDMEDPEATATEWLKLIDQPLPSV